MTGMGALLGGIGDIISATNYERPHLPEPTDPERRLRRLAQGQLIGGGQELLAGTHLYNQLAPILMGMLPGMHYVPGEGGGPPGAGGGVSPSMGSYDDSLHALQQTRDRNNRLTALNAQIAGMKKGAERRGLRQERKQLKKDIKGAPKEWQLEQQMYRSGTQPGSFDIRQAPAATPRSSLGNINELLSGLQGSMGGYGGTAHPDLMSAYNAGRY